VQPAAQKTPAPVKAKASESAAKKAADPDEPEDAL
jgi:hypothetical protein